jgi:hypothetical protein
MPKPKLARVALLKVLSLSCAPTSDKNSRHVSSSPTQPSALVKVLGCYDALVGIASYCHRADIINLQLVCKAARRAISDTADVQRLLALSCSAGQGNQICCRCEQRTCDVTLLHFGS